MLRARLLGKLNFVKGDRVEIIVDLGDSVRAFEVVATRQGRRVETRIVRGTVEVSEVTRWGQAVRTARFIAGRVVALVEYPAAERMSATRPADVSDDQTVLDLESPES